MIELNHKHKSIILNVFEEYKDVMIQNGFYDSELQKGIEEVSNLNSSQLKLWLIDKVLEGEIEVVQFFQEEN